MAVPFVSADNYDPNSKIFKVIWTMLTDGVLFGISDLESDWRV